MDYKSNIQEDSQYIKLLEKNVGIGTITPNSKLEVTGNVSIGTTTAAPTNGLLVAGNVGLLNNSELNLGYNQGGGAKLYYNTNGNLDITPRTGYNTVFTAGNVVSTNYQASNAYYLNGTSTYINYTNTRVYSNSGIESAVNLVAPSVYVTGLATNYIPKVGTGGLLGNSNITDDGSTIYFNKKINVDNNTGTQNGIYVGSTTAGSNIYSNKFGGGSGNHFEAFNGITTVFTILTNGDTTANKFIKSGGTSTQFLKADGSVDSSTYQTALTNPVTGTGVANRVALWSGTTTQTSNANLTFDGTTFNVGGTLTATVKSFVIDHPTKPNKKLQYGVLEGPEHSVYVRGKLTGTNTIQLPDHWIGLVHEDTITVNLTPIGNKQDLWVQTVDSTQIVIQSQTQDINCFYTVFAERKDIDKLITEFDK